MKDLIKIVLSALAIIFGMKKAKQEGREEVEKEVNLATEKEEVKLEKESIKQRNSSMSDSDIDEWL